MGNVIISVRDLERVYPGAIPVHALRGVSFDISRGEFVALIGRSGSGKSTLLRQLGLLDVPTKGSIFIDGRNILQLSEHERTHERLSRIGYIFQEFALLTEFTALENVAIPVIARHDVSPKKVFERAARVLKRVGLEERMDHYPNELSGGEQQRVAIARALVNRPAILLADEPTANLDSGSSETVLRLLYRLCKEEGQTILMISHEEEDKKWTDKVLHLKDGMIQRIEIPT